MPRVSVVVPFHERQDQLDRLLAGLDRQTMAATTFELVVADDGSATGPRVGQRAYGCRVVRQDDHGFRAAAARNLGARNASGQILVFLDQDCVPSPGYLADVSEAAVSSWSLIVGHRLHVDLKGWSAGAVGAWLTDGGPAPPALPEPQWLLDGYARTESFSRPDPRSYQLVVSAVLSMARPLFDRLGGFDEAFLGYGGEDWELGHRALVAGADTRWLPDAVVWHDGPDLAGRVADITTTKNAETMALAALVPDRDLRGEHLVWKVPDIIVRMRAADASVATLLASIEGLLGGSDAQVWVDGPSVGEKLLGIVQDPRIHVGEAPIQVRDRARYVVECEPILIRGATLRELAASAPLVTDSFRLSCVRDDNRAARGLPAPPTRSLPHGVEIQRLVEEPTLERLWQGRPAARRRSSD